MRYIYLVAYVISIFVANLLIDKFIELPFYGMLSAGTIFFAFVFTLRDHLHRYGIKFALLGILLALIVNTSLSIIFAIPIRFIIASFLAIFLSELADTAVFERLKARSWAIKVMASNAVSVPVDSVVMTIIAFAGIFTVSEMAAIIFADILAKYLIALTVIIRPERIRTLWLKLWKEEKIMFIPETRVMSYRSPHHEMTIDLIANRNPHLKTEQCHILAMPILCTRSQNPGEGSELYIRYKAKGYFLELFSLDRYLAAFYEHQSVRDIEYLTQEVAKDCANALGHKVIVEVFVNLNGVKQKQHIVVKAKPSIDLQVSD